MSGLMNGLRPPCGRRKDDEHLVRLVALVQELATDRSGSSRAAFRPWKPPLACSRPALCSQPAPEDSLVTTEQCRAPSPSVNVAPIDALVFCLVVCAYDRAVPVTQGAPMRGHSSRR